MTTPPSVQHLSLAARPLASFPDPSSPTYQTFTSQLITEATSILHNPSWTSHKSWHGGLVETYTLPLDAIHEVELDDPTIQQEVLSPIVEKKSFWGGGGGGTVKSAREVEKAADRGIAWHMRKSVRGTEGETGFGFECYWDTLAIRHAEQESEYVKTIREVLRMGDGECWLKLYDLPFPTTNRSFLAYLLVLDTTPPSTPDSDSKTAPLRSFLCFSLPVAADPTLTKEIDKGFVRGKYVAVERIREVRNESGEVEVEWMCASQSTPGGSIPTRLAEGHMQGSMASHVQPYFEWLSAKYPPGSERPDREKI